MFFQYENLHVAHNGEQCLPSNGPLTTTLLHKYGADAGCHFRAKSLLFFIHETLHRIHKIEQQKSHKNRKRMEVFREGRHFRLL